MSNALKNSALGGVAVVGVLALALATGVIDWPFDAVPEQRDAGLASGSVSEASTTSAETDQPSGVSVSQSAETDEKTAETAAPSAGTDEALVNPVDQSAVTGDQTASSVARSAEGADSTAEARATTTDDTAQMPPRDTNTTSLSNAAPEVTSDAPSIAMRLLPGSSIMVTGRSGPGEIVEVLFDGAPVTQVQTERDGSYATLIDLPRTGPTRLVRARVTRDGQERLSETELIIPGTDVPTAPEPQVASLAPDGMSAPSAAGTAPQAPGDSDEVAVLRPEDLDAEPAPGTTPFTAQSAPAPRANDTTSGMASPQDDSVPTLPRGSDAVAVVDPSPEVSSATPGSAPNVDTRPARSATPETTALMPQAPTVPNAPETDMIEDPAVTTRSEPGRTDSPQVPRRPGILVAGPAGVEALDKAPLLPGDVALDSISYDTAGEVILAGRGVDEAFVRVYLDNRPLTTSRISGGDWRVQLPEVDTGTYTLRVDQVDAEGTVMARVESPFLREDRAVLEQLAEGAGPVSEITVQPGHSLWAISEDRYGNGIEYVKIFRANRDRIRDPDLIYPGQIFDLPSTQQASTQPATE
ncbi:LysM peptidoglycan-binding domain-containing protein [Sagittula sp. NFXS13]|uniref:LysM peptidoglycan-binding domain-containing protein n=1 Tax=Sagittula sp. NFXS13 TaxID=2819095 RepID=UPI0032DF268C